MPARHRSSAPGDWPWPRQRHWPTDTRTMSSSAPTRSPNARAKCWINRVMPRARAQLARQSGKTVRFHSAVAVLHRAAGYQDLFVDTTTVQLRPLSAAEIEDYVKADQPLDCAGALRSESLGVALCERILSEDPTGLVGLPLIRLAASLRACGCPLP